MGLVNDLQEPGEPEESLGDSWRATVMMDYKPSRFSTLRFQVSNGDYAVEDGAENIWEGFLQRQVMLGSHRAGDGHSCMGH